MYKENDDNQIELDDFYLPFGGHLDPNNRWIILSQMVPWDKLEREYKKKLGNSNLGAPAKSFRMALGALIIKEKLQISDREVVEQIRENHYLQYFLGMEGCRDEEPFDPSMMVHFRKRLDGEIMSRTNEVLFREFRERARKKKRKDRKQLKKQIAGQTKEN